MNSINLDEYFQSSTQQTTGEVLKKIVSELTANKVSLDKILESLEYDLINKLWTLK